MPISQQEIIQLLRSQARPSKAKQLASSVRKHGNPEVSRRDVNRILYLLKQQGIAKVDANSCWTIVANRSTNNEQVPDEPATRQTVETYYDILQISRAARPEIVDKAYKVLVNLFHPDRAPVEHKQEFEERMKKINLAYETLSDKRKRAIYDSQIGPM